MPTDGEDLSSHMRRVQEYVTQQLIEAGDRSIRDDGRDFTPQVGDRVYLSTDNLSNRLDGSEDSRLRDRFIGPFIVLKREATGVHIEVPYDWHIRQPIAIHRLRPCRDRSLPPVSGRVCRWHWLLSDPTKFHFADRSFEGARAVRRCL